jgi:ATP-dependent helicase HrpB
MQTDLPINDVLAELRAALAVGDNLVLEAPPGAGKTTIVPLALRNASWLGQQKIIMLEPRRVAARAAAERMASLLGEKAGQTVGYRVRLDKRISAQTTIEVITEGILTRRLQTDPGLEGVGLLIFDEFHERSLDSDLGLALALQGRELFRDGAPQVGLPLKILVMSATLDGAAVAALLGDAPVISSGGKMFPVELHYGKRAQPKQDIAVPVVATLAAIMSKPETGNVLVFLPGQAEIRRVQESLPPFAGVTVAPLHGGLTLEQQRAVVAPQGPSGGPGTPGGSAGRKIVLATNIAETSLTIEGITTVVDAGLAREAVFDPGTGMTRLQTRRISQDSATQRMGRAGRLGPGQCYRLWSEDQQAQLSAHSTAEILQADLAPLALQLLAWGVDDPADLNWLDTPPEGPWQQALDLLRDFGAVEGVQLTADGQEMARLPVHPRLAHMLLLGCRWGMQTTACNLAALIAEGARQRTADIEASLTRLSGRVKQLAKQYASLCRALPQGESRAGDVGLLLAAAYPDRIGRRRQAKGNVYQLSNGRSAALDDSDSLCNQAWLVAVELGGRVGMAEDRIYLAAALPAAVFEHELADRVETVQRVEWDEKAGRLIAETQRKLGAIVLSREPSRNLSAQARGRAMSDFLGAKGLDSLPWNEQLRSWQARVVLLHQQLGAPWPDISDSALRHDRSWLEPYLGEVRRWAELDLKNILLSLLPWPLPRELDELAPERLRVPSGSSIRIDYSQSPPVLAVKLQEMFGCETTPLIARGQVPLVIHLLSPAQRPLQVTQDLASFWRNGYAEVKKEMRGRYPRHPWPDDPLAAQATGKTNRRLRTD